MYLSDFNPKSAIYIIRCTKNGRFYIGKSADVMQRLREHHHGLVSGWKKCSLDFICDVKKYGPESFEIEIIPCDEKDLDKEESRRIREAHKFGMDLYNQFIPREPRVFNPSDEYLEAKCKRKEEYDEMMRLNCSSTL